MEIYTTQDLPEYYPKINVFSHSHHINWNPTDENVAEDMLRFREMENGKSDGYLRNLKIVGKTDHTDRFNRRYHLYHIKYDLRDEYDVYEVEDTARDILTFLSCFESTNLALICKGGKLWLEYMGD